ncbi:hypothetical protein GRJ2_001764100 [Grus japonensis]|uniref:Uncharacterized protein n=1 Tax=Grus japonensis TaxID=30415 RepID=A0ABC9X5M8_GRUJA
MYNIAAAVPRVWMWLTQRALQDTRIQQWDVQSQAYLILSIWHCWRNNKFLPVMHHSGIHHDREISKPRSIITEDV